jgi:hypothetical protein
MKLATPLVTSWACVVASAFALGCSGSLEPGEELAEQAEISREMLVARPAARLVLTSAVVQRLQQRAAAGDPAWTALKERCEGYATGTMYAPSSNAYPNYPNVGQGYQGEEYLPVIRALGLCYRTASDAASQSRYAAAGERLLDAMSTPVGSGGQAPSTDSGYGIRNYVVGMAFGYDWLYPALSAATKSRVISSINTWIDWYDQSGFIKDDPIGNYFSGYFLAKTTAALATEGDNAKAATYWNDVVTRMWGKLVKPRFSGMMAGGGWPEGWGYGKKAVLSMVEALWATKTATGLDWWKELPLARDESAYAMQFSWPSLEHMDDQGTIRGGTNLRPSVELFSGLATMLDANGESGATSRSFAADVLAAAGDDRAPWSKFLYGDPNAVSSSYKSSGLSHFASGPGHVGMRSAWNTSATWGAFSAGPYINAAYSGEQLFHAGSLSVVVGDQPVLINPTGWLPQHGGTAGEDAVYDDSYGKRQRRLYNTFFVDDSQNPYNPGQNSFGPVDSKAHVESYEDRGGFVRARGVSLGDQYGTRSARPITQFTRDMVYVRPGSFVLFDRTTVAQASADQWLSFHTPVPARTSATLDSTQRRFDVVVGTTQVGSIRTLLPKSASTSAVSLPASAARLEVHAPVRAAAQQWLTVITTGSVSGEQTRLSGADGNVASGNLVGVELAAPQSQVVLFASDQAGTSNVSSADYTVARAAAEHVLVDVEPAAAGYSVTATVAGDKLRISVRPGGSFRVSAQESLSFRVSESGSVTVGSAAPPASTTPTPTPTPTPIPMDPAPTTPSDPIPAPPSGATQTLSFTQGVSGYAGAQDGSISNLNYSASSNPTGTAYKSNDTLYVYALDYTTKALLKFDISQVPSTARVTAASLDVTFESWSNPQTVLGSYVETPWSLAASAFGWTQGGSGSAWGTPGIGPSDLLAPTFAIAGINASGYQRRTIGLDTATVQSWVGSAAANQGVLLVNQDAGKVLRIFSSEASNSAYRPTLKVTFQ